MSETWFWISVILFVVAAEFYLAMWIGRIIEHGLGDDDDD